MRLSDIMASLDLTVFPQVALIIFLVVFAAVVGRVMSRSRRSELDRAALLPFEDGTTRTTHGSTP